MSTDASATRHEEPDDATAGATRHEAAGRNADETHYEGHDPAAAPGAGAGPRWVVLPDAILAEYDYLEDISSSGAQADVVLCRHTASGELVAIKVYRTSAGSLDPAALEKLRRASPDHVVPVLAVGSGQRRVWEVQEYFPEGSLQRVLDAAPSGMPPEQVLAITKELMNAISHVHGLGIIHRDLKPDNVLVRSRQPLDLVLGDFGVARQQAVTQVAGSVAGSMAYMAPEASFGLTSRPGDWWALGIILYQALTGRHLFASSTGPALLPEAGIRVALGQGTYVIGELPDERWTRLIRGLLTWAPDERWCDVQIRAWLAGKDPAVAEHRVGPSAAEGVSPGALSSFPFDGSAHATPAELAAAFRRGSSEAGQLIADPRATERLRAWLGQHGLAAPVDAILRSNPGPDLATVLLQAVMDPSHAPVFRGVQLDAPGLLAVADRTARGDGSAVSWIRAMRAEQVLGEWAAVARGAEELGIADERLRSWWNAIDAMAPAARSAVTDGLEVAEGLLLRAAVDEASRRMLGQRNASTLAKLDMLPEPFVSQARLIAEDQRESALGVRTLFAAQVAVERPIERARRAAASRARWGAVRAQAWRNARAGAVSWAWRSLIVTAPIAVAACGLTYSWSVPPLLSGLGPWWLGFILTGGLLRVFHQRSSPGLRWIAAGCLSLWWAGKAFAALGPGMAYVEPGLWQSAILATGLAGVAGWLGGFLPVAPARQSGSTAAARADRVSGGFTNASVVLLVGVWMLLLARLFVVTLPGPAAPVIREMNGILPGIKSTVSSWTAPIASAQPAWMLPGGALVVFVVGGLMLVLSRRLPLPTKAKPAPGFVTTVAAAFVVLGNLGWLWMPLTVLGMVAAGVGLMLFIAWLGLQAMDS